MGSSEAIGIRGGALGSLSAGLALAMAAWAPWAFGSVEDWAILVLGVALTILAGLSLLIRGDRVANLLSWPSLALLGIVGLGVIQLVPLPEFVVGLIAPGVLAERASLLPESAEVLRGSSPGTVPLPTLRLSRNPEATQVMVVRLAAIWVFLQCVLHLRPDRTFLRRYSLLVLVNATAMAIVAALQWLTWNGRILWLRESPRDASWYSGGPFFNHNNLAAYLNMGLGMALAWILIESRRSDLDPTRPRGLAAIPALAGGLIALGLVGSHSRGAMLACAASTLILLVPLIRHVGRSPRLLGGIAVVPILMVVYLVAVGSESPLARVATIPTELVENVRYDLWGAALEAWTYRPVWGSGLGSFSNAADPYFPYDNDLAFLRAENEYIDMLVEGGLVGLTLMLFGLVGVVRRTVPALAAADEPEDRSLMLGATFAGLTLMLHWLTDFSLHVPGVAVTVWILVGILLTRGREAVEGRSSSEPTGIGRRLSSLVIALAMIALSVLTVVHSFGMTIAETYRAEGGIRLSEREKPGADDSLGVPALQRQLESLERMIEYRPDSAEIHFRRGLTYLQLYRNASAARIGEEVRDPILFADQIDPYTPHLIAHTPDPEARLAPEELAEVDLVQEYLVPATRSFLEARRCCPIWADPHIQLAGFDYLFTEADQGLTYLQRGLDLCGAESGPLLLVGLLAAQRGEVDLASKAWRRSLEARPGNWTEIVDVAGVTLGPQQLLDEVLPESGDLAVKMGDRLYYSPISPLGRNSGLPDAERIAFMEEALRRLRLDNELPNAERLSLEARALSRLDRRDEAVDAMERAIMLSSRTIAYRVELARWLLDWDRIEEANQLVEDSLRIRPGQADLERLRGRIRRTLRNRP